MKELRRLGRQALKALQLRRRILKHRPGPKMSDEKEIIRMEVQIRGIMLEIGKMPSRPEPEIAALAVEMRQAIGKYNPIKKPLEESPSRRSKERFRTRG